MQLVEQNTAVLRQGVWERRLQGPCNPNDGAQLLQGLGALPLRQLVVLAAEKQTQVASIVGRKLLQALVHLLVDDGRIEDLEELAASHQQQTLRNGRRLGGQEQLILQHEALWVDVLQEPLQLGLHRSCRHRRHAHLGVPQRSLHRLLRPLHLVSRLLDSLGPVLLHALVDVEEATDDPLRSLALVLVLGAHPGAHQPRGRVRARHVRGADELEEAPQLPGQLDDTSRGLYFLRPTPVEEVYGVVHRLQLDAVPKELPHHFRPMLLDGLRHRRPSGCKHVELQREQAAA
mmetsp:Transcript_38321/g.110146  ORF Transcript_38321/g.110146 Transcript_38321/m.110146 type:complete len:289 (-) Transcript_38321:889-1755(-)